VDPELGQNEVVAGPLYIHAGGASWADGPRRMTGDLKCGQRATTHDPRHAVARTSRIPGVDIKWSDRHLCLYRFCRSAVRTLCVLCGLPEHSLCHSVPFCINYGLELR
jgi:hypothetical protein